MLIGEQKHRRGVLVDLGLGLQFKQRHRRIAVQPPGRIDEMTDSLERRAVIGQVILGQRAERIGAFQALQYPRFDIQRHPRAVRGFGQQQLFVRSAPPAAVLDGGERPAVGHQKIVNIVTELDVVEPSQQRLQTTQHHGAASARGGARRLA